MTNANRNKTPLSPANLEQSIRDESLAAQGLKRLDRPCRIHVHSQRHRLTDAGGACDKYVIDAIVDAGLLKDDSPKEVKKVSSSQEKITKEFEEVTIITIEEV